MGIQRNTFQLGKIQYLNDGGTLPANPYIFCEWPYSVFAPPKMRPKFPSPAPFVIWPKFFDLPELKKLGVYDTLKIVFTHLRIRIADYSNHSSFILAWAFNAIFISKEKTVQQKGIDDNLDLVQAKGEHFRPRSGTEVPFPMIILVFSY